MTPCLDAVVTFSSLLLFGRSPQGLDEFREVLSNGKRGVVEFREELRKVTAGKIGGTPDEQSELFNEISKDLDVYSDTDTAGALTNKPKVLIPCSALRCSNAGNGGGGQSSGAAD